MTPREMKNIEANIMRRCSAPSLKIFPCLNLIEEKETPARNDPTIADKPTKSALIEYKNAIIMAKMKIDSGYLVPILDLSNVTMTLANRNLPTRAPTTIKPKALAAVIEVRENDNVPEAICPESERANRRQYVVNYGSSDNGFGGRRLKFAHFTQHIGSDGNAGGSQGSTNKDGCLIAEVEQFGQKKTTNPGDNYAAKGNKKIFHIDDFFKFEL